MLGNKLLNIQFAKYHIWNNKSEGFPNMVLSTETFNQSVRTEYSEAVNARYTFQPLWVSGSLHKKRFQRETSELFFRPRENRASAKKKEVSRPIFRAAKTLKIFHGNACYAG